MNIKLTAIIITFICSIFGAIGQLFFKLGSKDLTFNLIEQLSNYKLIIGLFFYGIATIGYVFALKQVKLSILYPIVALSYVWVMILSIIFLKEIVPIYKWFGVLGLIISVGILSF